MVQQKVEKMPYAYDQQYLERVYAGVLGKIIGVYLGRPFEGWDHEVIMEHFGDINYYVHEELNVPLIVTDDDISGTFTFVRALEDYGFSRNISPAQIGHTWLNYIIEKQAILWWGGMGNSTEHTAFLRLKSGIEAPQSGSIELNSQIVAEQIGAQIFIDGWAMVAPGDPELAADFAKRAASVSHDGEAIYGAQVIASMEAQAFVENDRHKLIDVATSLIPKDSLIHRMIQEIVEWHAKEPDWRRARESLVKNYGYDIYGGNCHMIPNHGLIIFSLLYGDDDFQKSMMIVNTSGWDTDCNAGNLGCLMGIKNGLDGINQGPDWREPVADKLYLPTADGGRSISDAASESIYLANMGRILNGLKPEYPKNKARFHFELPGSVQGFASEKSIAASGTCEIENVLGHSKSGTRSLAIRYKALAKGRVTRVETPTFSPSAEISNYFVKRGYPLIACPTLYSGQMLKSRIVSDRDNDKTILFSLYIKHYNAQDELSLITSKIYFLEPGQEKEITWQIPNTNCYPIAFVGCQINGDSGEVGTVYLDYLSWEGSPNIKLNRPIEKPAGRLSRDKGPIMWKTAWVDGLVSNDRLTLIDYWPEPYRLIQNTGRGLLIQGTREWIDYQVKVRMNPHMCEAGGIGIRVQGMTRYYALMIDQSGSRLIKAYEGKDQILSSCSACWKFGSTNELVLQVNGNHLIAFINNSKVLEADDLDNSYLGGAMALIAEEGRIGCDYVEVCPLS